MPHTVPPQAVCPPGSAPVVYPATPLRKQHATHQRSPPPQPCFTSDGTNAPSAGRAHAVHDRQAITIAKTHRHMQEQHMHALTQG